MAEQHVCGNCNQPGSHFCPPSLGEPGFYSCGPGPLQEVVDREDRPRAHHYGGGFYAGRTTPPGSEHLARRRQRCAALHKYGDRFQARQRAKDLKKKAYRCPFCKHWHVPGCLATLPAGRSPGKTQIVETRELDVSALGTG